MKKQSSSQNQSETGKRPRRFLKGFFLVLAALLLVASIFYLTQYRDVGPGVAEETTFVTQPLNESGGVDFLKAFEELNYSDRIATEKNGFRAIIEQVDVSENLPSPHFEQVCTKLGVDPNSVTPTLTYVDPYDFVSDYYRSDDFDEKFVRNLELTWGRKDPDVVAKINYSDWGAAGEAIVFRSIHPWNENDLPMMKEWVQQSSPVLDLYAKAVRQPSFEIPFSRDDSATLYEALAFHVQMFRSIARGYQSRANYHLGNGNVRQAMEDVISCKRLGRHVRNRNTFVDRIIGVVIESMADSIGVIDVKDDRTTQDDLAFLADELNNLPPVSNLDQSILHSKLANLDWLRKRKNQESLKWLGEAKNVKYLRSLGLDWNVVFAEFNQMFDQIWKNRQVENQNDVEVTNLDLFSRVARSKKFARWYARTNTGLTLLESENRTKCAEQLRNITIAMLRYEKEHGSLPPAFTADEKGQPLHSWRVLLLPYLGQQKVFDQIRLDEPWNSPQNSMIGSNCPSVYACPSCPECAADQTSYSVILGEDLPFEGDQGKMLNAFGNDCNDMILISERTRPVPWMDPTREITRREAELGINFADADEQDRAPIGSSHNYGSVFGHRNGSVHFRQQQYDMEIFKKMLRGTNQDPYTY